MTKELAESVKDLAKPTVEALKVVTERECSLCQGKREFNPNSPIEGCPTCSGTGKVRWKWEPKVGDWFFHAENKICLVYYFDNYHQNTQIYYVKKGELNRYTIFQGEYTIPILHWETLEGVLEGVGYRFSVRRNVNPDSNGIRLCDCIISHSNGHRAQVIGKSRQEAVMRSVIALGKEIDAKTK